MFAKIMNLTFGSAFLSKVSVCLVLFCMTKSVSAIEARKPEISLADRIQLENKIHREKFYGDVRLLHTPYPIDVQFSSDGSVLFSLAETVRLWRSDTGEYLGSIAGPERFIDFAQLNNSRWIVTLDDRESFWERGLYSGVPQVLPRLRVWDVITGTCLGIRPLEIPANATSISVSTIETAEQYQTTYLILEYTDEKPNEDWPWGRTVCELQGFRGSNLIPVCRLKLENFQNRLESPIDHLTWDPHTRRLYIFGKSAIESFDPVSRKIEWTTIPGNFAKPVKRVNDVIVIDQPLPLNKRKHGKKKYSSTILVTLFPSREKNLEARNKFILLEWALVDPLSGKVMKTGVINSSNLKPVDWQPEKHNKEALVYWLYDDNDDSVKAINILKNQLLFTFPWSKNGFSRTRLVSTRPIRDLYHDGNRAVNKKVIWSPAANRVCYIEGEEEAFDLFNPKTGKRVVISSGTVNALSSLSANHISATFDWNEVSVFHVESHDRVTRTFNKTAPENSCVAISADATTLLVGKDSGQAQVWNLADHKRTVALTGVSKKLLCIAADPSQQKIVAGDIEGTFWQWKYPGSSEVEPQLLNPERNDKPEKLPHQKVRLDTELTVPLCSVSPNALLSLSFQPLIDVSQSYLDNFDDQVVSPGLALVAYMNSDLRVGEVIAIENAKKQTILTPAVPHKSILIQIKSSSNGRFVILVFNTGQITIVDLQDGTLESIIQTGNHEIVDVDYHPDQKTLFAASYRGTVTAWNTETYLKTGSLQLYDARLNLLSSRVVKKGFDLVLGTQDTGLIVKRGAFPKSEQKPQRPASISLPFRIP